MSENVLILNSIDFEETLKNTDKPVLVDFWAQWCMPCKMQAPILNELADELKGKVVIAKVNVDESEDLAIKYQVNAIPFLAIFKNGDLKESKVGLTDKNELSLILEKYM